MTLFRQAEQDGWRIAATDELSQMIALHRTSQVDDVPVAGAEKLRVTGPDGKPLPVRVAPATTKDHAILLFPADLPKDATVNVTSQYLKRS
jgi:hypothetical protein